MSFAALTISARAWVWPGAILVGMTLLLILWSYR
jgi:hypothetical protein